MSTSILPQIGSDALTDEQVIERVLSGETALYELIMRRYNQRLYRTVRAILRNDDEVEDVMQDAYVRAYRHLGDFAGRSQFSTWLTRIAIHEAFASLRRGKRTQQFDDESTGRQYADASNRDSSGSGRRSFHHTRLAVTRYLQIACYWWVTRESRGL